MNQDAWKVLPFGQGFSIFETESLDEAAQMATGCPILHSNGTVSVFGTIQIA